jgi:uncharacterized protein (DUF1501 family)
MHLSRRNFLSSACAGAALTTIAPGLRVSFAAETTSQRDIVVVLFQRGACDGLQLVAPAGDPNYQLNRPTLQVPTSGPGAGLPIGSLDQVDFFLNPAMPELQALYAAGNLAVVHAVGIPTANRSHFVVQNMMERGVADGDPALNTGWLDRHLLSLGGTRPLLGTIANGPANPTSLLGYPNSVAVPDVSTFSVHGGNSVTKAIQTFITGNSAYQGVAQSTLQAVAAVQSGLANAGTGNDPDAGYTKGPLSANLKSLARLIKMNVGVDLSTVDMLNWDMHSNLLADFHDRATELSQSLNAFWNDLSAYQSRLTLVTMTEFGRRVPENTSGGTDHGSGGAMLVMGGNVNGGIYGDWPGLAANQLYQGDLAVANDYRNVLLEILIKRHGETAPQSIFPTVSYNPLGVVSG